MTKTLLDKEGMYLLGVDLVRSFCELNELTIPKIQRVEKGHALAKLDSCAWYRSDSISIKVWDCASIGQGGMAWSYPGYVIDRTPYGVLAHELGHHCDVSRSVIKHSYSGTYSKQVRKESGEAKLTNYCPNDAEWFAEMMRLFITNPNLLKNVRPRTYALIRKEFYPVVTEPWRKILIDAPKRTIEQAMKKIQNA